MASTLVIGGSALVQRVFLAGMTVTAVTGVWMGWMARTQRMTVTRTTIAWFLVSMGGCSTMLYYGMFSPVGMMVAVFVVFFVGTRDERGRGGHGLRRVRGVPSRAGRRDRRRYHPGARAIPFSDGELGKLAVTELLIQLVLLATLVGACAIRRSMVGTVRTSRTGPGARSPRAAARRRQAGIRGVAAGRRCGRFSHQILGSYRLGRLLGEGAMGEVYDAIDTRTGTAAAGQAAAARVMENRGIVQRFLTEARIVTSLRSDHVAHVLETADPGSSLPYIAMERLHGHDLRKYLRSRRRGRLSLREADDLLRQVARGIDAAHRADVVHRDLKPSNLFREDTGTWKVLDFGVSKVIGEHTAEHSSSVRRASCRPSS